MFQLTANGAKNLCSGWTKGLTDLSPSADYHVEKARSLRNAQNNQTEPLSRLKGQELENDDCSVVIEEQHPSLGRALRPNTFARSGLKSRLRKNTIYGSKMKWTILERQQWGEAGE